jgi:hypothetical protein
MTNLKPISCGNCECPRMIRNDQYWITKCTKFDVVLDVDSQLGPCKNRRCDRIG